MRIWLKRVDVGYSLPEKYKTKASTRAETGKLRSIFSSLLCMRTARRTLR